ncbi:Rab-like 6, partial [Dryobates pubescens]
SVKIVIRGDRNTGKTTLWHRLQGKKFLEEYIPTQEIQVTSIHWNYKTTDDIVKGKCKKRGDGLKLENDPQEAESELALDAEFLDVYKNCNGVVMMFDITKQWTFNYILRELPKVPTHVPVCVLGNYRDMGEHRVILPGDVRDPLLSAVWHRAPGASYFHYAESSMKNSFGLKYLHKFFNIPFLQLQRETLLRQLETNQLDIDATLEELSVQQETEDQNYELYVPEPSFLPLLLQPGPQLSAGQPQLQPLAARGAQGVQFGSLWALSNVTPGTPPATAGCPRGHPRPGSQPPAWAACASVSHPHCAQLPPDVQPNSALLQFQTLVPGPLPSAPPQPACSSPAAPAKVQSLEDFVPEESLDHSFLEEPPPQGERGRLQAKLRRDSESDGEAPGGNPMVAGFQDDLDLDDKIPSRSMLAAERVPSKNITLSSEEEEEEEEELKDSKVTARADTEKEQDKKRSSRNSLKPQSEAVLTKATELKAAASFPPRSGSERSSSSKARQRGSKEEKPEESDSDQEGPIATQMLSFVMDDPDFESEDSDSPRKRADEFPVREDVSELSDEDDEGSLAKPPPPVKAAVPSFKLKNDSDLFGLGLEEPGPKESSEEGK